MRNNAQIQQARTALEQALINLERTDVVAPSDGLITDLRRRSGQFCSGRCAPDDLHRHSRDLGTG